MTGTSELVVRDLRRRYGDTRALDGLDLVARGGEVLGVAGPNGAGKSTLMRILAGEEVQDDGEITLDGAGEWAAHARARVAVVHQEPQLFPNLTVAQNLVVGREGWRLGRPRLTDADRALMDQLNIRDLAHQPLGSCSLAAQQRTEIARALARDARVFLFDEPNSALTDQESLELFEQIRALAAAGRVVLLVSHRLEDLVTHTQRVAIVRDGRVQCQLEGAKLTKEDIARQLVLGTASAEGASRESAAQHGEVVLRLDSWSDVHGAFAGVELSGHAGEVIALMGVEGSGGRELLRSIAVLEAVRGTVSIAGAEGAGALRTRTAYVPATRELSLFTNLDVGQNVVVRLDRDIAGRCGVLRQRKTRALAAELVERFRVKTDSLRTAIRSLSGGNQQKVAIAAAMAERPRVLLLEEPTRGVDIASKAEIYRLLRGFAQTGNVVLLFCTEVSEVFDAADRVHVVSDGRLSEALDVHGVGAVDELAARITRLERHEHAAAGAL